jgi:hypothetical protein
MCIQKVFVELKRRKKIENLAVFDELKGKMLATIFSICYQDTIFFGGNRSIDL